MGPLEAHSDVDFGEHVSETERPIGTSETSAVRAYQGAEYDQAKGQNHEKLETECESRTGLRAGTRRVALILGSLVHGFSRCGAPTVGDGHRSNNAGDPGPELRGPEPELQVESRFVDIPGIMVAMPLNETQNDDPRKLRALLDKVVNLADDHSLTSVVVGMSGPDGDLIFPEVVDFVGSALRIDDAIFRMTRSRAVLFLADADRGRAEEIMARVIDDFTEQFATAESPPVGISYFEVAPGTQGVTLKAILPRLFAPDPNCH
jgi:hypothetical protein